MVWNVNIGNPNNWLSDHYGSRWGFIRAHFYRTRYLLGGYRDCRQIDWGSAGRLVFVCKGNICRSAYAEAVTRSMGKESVSCGIDTKDGLPANDHAICEAASRGVDLREHKTTSIKSLTLKDNDIFIAMEPWHAEFISREFGNEQKCSLLGLWGQPVNPHIQDPYGTSDEYFSNCFTYIEKSVNEIARKISETS